MWAESILSPWSILHVHHTPYLFWSITHLTVNQSKVDNISLFMRRSLQWINHNLKLRCAYHIILSPCCTLSVLPSPHNSESKYENRPTDPLRVLLGKRTIFKIPQPEKGISISRHIYVGQDIMWLIIDIPRLGRLELSIVDCAKVP